MDEANVREDSRPLALRKVPQHDGTPFDADMDFFLPPPDDIGNLISAHSPLRHSQPVIHQNRWRVLVFAIVVLAIPLCSFLFDLNLRYVMLYSACVTFFILLMFQLSKWFEPADYECTYVGTDGIACFRGRGSKRRTLEQGILRFADAAALRTNQPAADDYPPPTSDWFAYAWFDRAGRLLFRIAGWRTGAVGKEDIGEAFGIAAETAWTNYRLDLLADELKHTERIILELALGGKLRLGRGMLEIEAGGLVRTWDRQLQPLVEQAGPLLRLHFAVENDKGDPAGICSIPLREAADARLILALLRILVLFDLPAVEGADEMWGGRTLSAKVDDAVTSLGGRADSRVIESQEGVQPLKPPTHGKRMGL